MSYRHVFEKMGDVSQLIKDMDRFFNAEMAEAMEDCLVMAIITRLVM